MILIEVKGGIVQAVYSEAESLDEIVVHDLDVEQYDPTFQENAGIGYSIISVEISPEEIALAEQALRKGD